MKKLTALILTSCLLITIDASAAPSPFKNLYVADPGADRIFRSELDGSDITSEVGGKFSMNPDGLALDVKKNTVYWSETSIGSIFKSDLKGDIKTLVTDQADSPADLAIDTVGGKLYWINKTIPVKITRADLDGTNIEDIYTATSSIGPDGLDLDLDANKIYWTDAEDFKIKKANLDGTVIEDVFDGLLSPSAPDIALDPANGFLYWIDGSNQNILRAKMDGTTTTPVVVQGLNATPRSIAIESGDDTLNVYWSEDSNEIKYFDIQLNAGPFTLLDTGDGLNNPGYIALGLPLPLTPDTTIDEAPPFELITAERKVTLTFKDFSGAIVEELAATAAATLPDTSKLVNKTPQVRYEAKVTNQTNNKIKKVVTKNTKATIKLPPGSYRASYKAKIVTAVSKNKKKKKIAKINKKLLTLGTKANTINNQNKKQELKAKKKLAGFKTNSETNDSPSTPQFEIE